LTESDAAALTPLDRVYLRRACELAARGRGSTSPNPCVGAVIARGATTLGEGFHRLRGEPHAEAEALHDAAARGGDVRGATVYVTLEPCDHHGLTPPCSQTLVDAGVARVVVGALDPNPRTAAGGIARLRAAGIAVVVAGDAWSRELVEDFACFVGRARPYVRVKLAASLDGFVAERPGTQRWLTGDESREYVRELRAAYDAVLVGAGTVRVDDPQLTVRPHRARRKPYVRAIACEEAPVPATRAIFAETDGYARTLVLAPGGKRAEFATLESVAEVLYVGEGAALDLAAALDALREHGVASVLCEGGPTLAARLIERGLVDRIDWLVAPVMLGGPQAVPALARTSALSATFAFDRVAQLGPDVLLSGSICSAA
jgi:diaminohydroxyphosphoribosylaminopyrimidine deaminase/5-amino-6-(5-phosphoribosylamino)uracil reductase